MSKHVIQIPNSPITAQAAYDEGQAALAAGDFAAYGEAQKKLEAALQSAADAEKRINGGTSA